MLLAGTDNLLSSLCALSPRSHCLLSFSNLGTRKMMFSKVSLFVSCKICQGTEKESAFIVVSINPYLLRASLSIVELPWFCVKYLFPAKYCVKSLVKLTAKAKKMKKKYKKNFTTSINISMKARNSGPMLGLACMKDRL